MCGERQQKAYQSARALGSAPRVRGTATSLTTRSSDGRFSPACAGNGCRAISASRALSVQPRVCGERIGALPNHGHKRGSAPRVRGTADRHGCEDGQRRFSPACAGNGFRADRCQSGGPVQPRVCGERLGITDSSNTSTGSAPRVRGTVLKPDVERYQTRFSPACAGNGEPFKGVVLSGAVQPRVCGERDKTQGLIMGNHGSAPRVRGTAYLMLHACYEERFSPACAGNGLHRAACWAARAVQPRVCGERTP